MEQSQTPESAAAAQATGDVPTPASESSGAPAASGLALEVRIGLAVVVLLALAALFWPSGDKSWKAPAGTLLDAGGRPTTVASQLAPVTLVHFWATWCPPCVEEVPKLQQFRQSLAADHEFKVLMVAVEETPQQVGSFLGPQASEGVVYDPKWEVANRYGTEQLPETYLVVDGKVVEKFVGATDWTDPKVQARIRQHLAKS